MNELKIFENSKFGELSVLNSEKYGPLFIGHEVAEMAGYKSPNSVVHNLADKFKVKLNYEDVKKLFSNMQKNGSYKISPNGLTMVNEPGLYKLAVGKNEEFENWVFFEVLPSIRKTGQYSSQPQLPDHELFERETCVKKLEDLKIAKPVEIANIGKQSDRAKLANLISTLSHEKKIGTDVLYERLYARYAEYKGLYIPLEAQNIKKTNSDYLRAHAIISKELYEFALTYFYRGKTVVELFNWDSRQKTLGEF